MSRIQRVCVLGGGGFVGRTLVPQLAASGREVRDAVQVSARVAHVAV